jgi:hypothetical protein
VFPLTFFLKKLFFSTLFFIRYARGFYNPKQNL